MTREIELNLHKRNPPKVITTAPISLLKYLHYCERLVYPDPLYFHNYPTLKIEHEHEKS